MNMDWLTPFASLATILSLLIIIYQQFQQSRSLEADIRAYLHVDVKKVRFKNRNEMVALTIYNSGEVTAENVQILAESEAKWFSLNGGGSPEFVTSESKLHVLPGEELTFLLGPLNELPIYKKVGLIVNIRYRKIPERKKVTEEQQLLSLEPQRYLLERKLSK